MDTATPAQPQDASITSPKRLMDDAERRYMQGDREPVTTARLPLRSMIMVLVL